MAYDLADLRTRVRSKIKDSSYSATLVDQFINDAIIEIADLYPWKFLQKVVSGTLTVGEYTYEQQSDHQITERLILIHPTDTDRFWNITKYFLNEDDFFEMYPSPESFDNSQPVYWTEYGDQIYFNCPVDLTYTLRQYYRKLPTELTGDADVPELPKNFREAIVLGASYRAEQERDNYDIAGVLQSNFDDRVGDLILRHANNTMIGPDTVILPPRQKDR